MLVVRSLTKSFDEKPVLTGLDLTVQPGEILFLTGPSGAGKSTALRAIANLDSYDAGHVSVDGHTPSSTGFSEWRRDVMYVPQTRISYPCTPRHLFERALNFKSRALMHFNLKESLERYVEICCQLGLDRPNIEQQKWTELSGGEFDIPFLSSLRLCPSI
ncbi:unnamed protein product [Chondrus crispus]|uniref:ABC transporter domain-containing protein n=1 Tax=Chondrus crispus TaxID=2769 RepID=R7QF80_CHOCR|nr:unnamed protein product [Chondrus crispus]CDF37182.1 unnamed protein product [Chondrus crispus]|eukprot:XP_005717001.1 unnamed protein product [Chondrus crispus]